MFTKYKRYHHINLNNVRINKKFRISNNNISIKIYPLKYNLHNNYLNNKKNQIIINLTYSKLIYKMNNKLQTKTTYILMLIISKLIKQL